MFEVMTLVTCDGTRVAGAGSPIGGQNRGSDDGPPGGGGWVPVETFGAITAVMGPQVAGLGAADDAGSEAAVAVVRACQGFCVSGLQVGGESVGVGGGELGQGLVSSRW